LSGFVAFYLLKAADKNIKYKFAMIQEAGIQNPSSTEVMSDDVLYVVPGTTYYVRTDALHYSR
jgi:hypothetical protein